MATAGRAVTGEVLVNSGFPDFRKPFFTATFPKAGLYRYVCLLHPLQAGQVRVVSTGRVPAPAQARARAGAERAAVQAAARQATQKANVPNPGATEVVTGVGKGKFSVFRFFPRNLTVKAGTAVTFRWASRNEAHTVTFGPTAYVAALEQGFEHAESGATVPPEVAFPSDPPGAGPAVVNPASRGNGFVNSGLVTDPGLGPPPHSFTALFDTPGSYDYLCIVHSDTMKGRVTVVP